MNSQNKALKYSVIIVTHNSERVFSQCLARLKLQTLAPEEIVVVDAASSSLDWLNPSAMDGSIRLITSKANVGFCEGNNIGYRALDRRPEYLLLLNPDAYLEPDTMKQVVAWMDSHEEVGIASPQLLGWDVSLNSPSGKIDSFGIGCTWYGKWFDISQGVDAKIAASPRQSAIKAICGAFSIIRMNALEKVNGVTREVFPPEYFMYKEDIYLSLALQKAGWKIAMIPQVTAFHCRGWNNDRLKTPYKLRFLSSKNDLRNALKFKRRHIPFSLLKLLYVMLVER